ncbi:aldo-keto reductase AKR2E4-like [Anticarsia gemmatalis]|uniref:aldo-keto reductase AKR2E4-like n=1 Tax=Anticarsia gemmatalis TaxID=129554 RepID=UPI003F75F619
MLPTGLIACVLLHMAASVEVPKLNMLDGGQMPAIALGTYLGFDQNGVVRSKSKELRDAVLAAVDAGYRHIDTAAIYETESEIGEALKMKFNEGVVKRDDMFITTKLWNTAHKKEQVEPAIRSALNKTGLDYFDLYLMHWPIALNEDNSYANVDIMETWRALEDVQRLGLTKSIGLSNFNKEQLQRVLSEGSIKPVALQIEVHPQIIQSDLISFCKSEGIIVMGYSPFGSLVMRYGLQFPGPKMDDPLLVGLGQKYGKTPAQIVLRWAVDRGVVPIPKTIKPSRLTENISIFDFKLTPDEIEKINQYNSNTRYTIPSFWQEHPNYPFEKIDNPVKDPFKKD